MDARPYELPPSQILQSLGTLLLSSTELRETLVFVLAEEFTQHADSARNLISGLSFEGLAERFGALYQERFPPPDGPEEIMGFVSYLKDLHTRRNALAHAIWLQWDTGATQKAERRPSQALRRRSDSGMLAATDILALAAELDIASHRLLEYRGELRGGKQLSAIG